MAMLRLVIKEQMGRLDDSWRFARFLEIAEMDHAHEIFKLLLDHHEMTPEILSSFMKHWVWAYRKNLIDLYLYPEPTLPREERLMRYALLRSVERPYTYAECKRLEPQNNLAKLRGIATRRRDRQSLSILFYCESENQANLKVSEMLSYVKSGGLSPATTRYFIDWAVRNGVELGDWPLEHLPRNSRRLPKEDRLSAWLCSGALEYKNVDMASFDDLYDRSGDMLINMRFTEPVKTKDGRVITRAAEYFILNAQVILDTYRGDQQQASKAIPIKDCRRILVGILYALAEGQHLDLSNTVLEMREGDETWACFENIAECSDYKNAARNALSYLKSDEIYGHVHRALPRQLGRDEKVVEVSEEMVKGIGQLSIN